MSEVNPYAVSNHQGVSIDAVDRERLRKIASAQRVANIVVLLSLLFGISFRLLPQAPELRTAIPIILVSMIVVTAFAMFRLTRLIRGPVTAVLYTIMAIVPVAGFLLLGIMSSTATQELKAAGVRVGLLGANPNSI